MSYAKIYNPLQVGTITGDTHQVIPHDNAIARAQYAKCNFIYIYIYFPRYLIYHYYFLIKKRYI